MIRTDNIAKSKHRENRARMILICAVSLCLVIAAVTFFSILSSTAKVLFINDPDLMIPGNYTESPRLAELLYEIFDGDINMYSESTEYFYEIGSVMDTKRMFTVYSKDGNPLHGYQCFIYANAVYNKLYGEPVGNGSYLSHSVIAVRNEAVASYELFKNAGVKCGAYMRTTENKNGSYNGSKGHSLIILKYDENEITYFEGNGEGLGYVRGAILSWQDFNDRQLGKRGRVICHIVQPTDSYYKSQYGDSKVYINYAKGSATSGNAPSSVAIGFNQTFTVKTEGNLRYGDYLFAGWSVRRDDLGLIKNTKGGWSTPEEIASGATSKRIYQPGNAVSFDQSFFICGDTHMSEGDSVTFYPEFASPPTPIPDYPMTVTSSYTSGDGFADLMFDITQNPGCSFLEITLALPSGIYVDSVENGTVLGGMYNASGTNVITWKMSGDLYGTGTLATVRLKARDGTLSGRAVGYTISKCCGLFGDVPLTSRMGSVRIY